MRVRYVAHTMGTAKLARCVTFACMMLACRGGDAPASRTALSHASPDEVCAADPGSQLDSAMRAAPGDRARGSRTLDERPLCPREHGVIEAYRMNWWYAFDNEQQITVERRASTAVLHYKEIHTAVTVPAKGNPRDTGFVEYNGAPTTIRTIVADTTFQLTSEEWQSITTLVTPTGLWSAVPHFDQSTVGLDGSMVWLAGVRGSQYRLRQLWSPDSQTSGAALCALSVRLKSLAHHVPSSAAMC